MRKEIVVAIIAGVLVGLIIAFGVWRANQAISETPKEKPTTTQNQPLGDFGLTLVSPSNRQVVSQDTITVSGATSPGASIVILTEKDEYLVTPDSEGAFEQKIELGAGLNQIVVFAFNAQLQTTTQNLNIVYSSQFDQEAESGATKEATDSAEALRQKVQEKIDEIASSPIFYIGAITDKQEETLQISNFALPGEKESSGSISQISTSDSTDILGLKGNSLSFSDVAIGDFIIAMGYTSNGDALLDAKRILITETPEKLPKMAVAGNISEIVSKKATVSSPEENLDITFGKSWSGPEVSEFEDSEAVIVVTEADGIDNLVLLIKKLSDL